MRVAINGLGRIGRLALKIGLSKGVNFVAINDLADINSLAYLIKYDSVYGRYERDVEFDKRDKNLIKVGNRKIKVFSEKNPENLPWKDLKVDLVIESTGAFTSNEDASRHLKAGAKRVLISAPGKNPDITVVMGVNDSKLRKPHRVISMASCTTNCLAPMAKILNDRFGIRKGFLTTAHAYTGNQSVVDCPSKDLRRGRAASMNIIPTTTGATKAVSEVIPELDGKLDGIAMRVPVPCGSIVDFVVELNKIVNKEKINSVFKEASKREMRNILRYSDHEIVSSDIIRDSHSCIFDGSLTMVKGNLVKVCGWYDNEYAYSYRLIDLIKKM